MTSRTYFMPSLESPQQPAQPPVAAPAPDHAPLRACLFLGHQPVEIHARDTRELWRQTAFFDSVPGVCGLCGSHDLSPVYRQVREHEFYSLQCRFCRASLPMGQRRDGGLYPNLKKGWSPAWAPSDAPLG